MGKLLFVKSFIQMLSKKVYFMEQFQVAKLNGYFIKDNT